MHFHPTERVALFIDGNNLYVTAKSLGIEIDFKRVRSFFSQKAHLVRALYYTAVSDDSEYTPVRPLLDWLDYNGFTLVTKPTKEFVDGEGRRKIKSNMDVELAVDAMQLAKSLDHIVIFSGDGDLSYLVTALQRMGKRVSIVSTLKSDPPMVSDELRREADCFVDILDLQQHIGRELLGSARNHEKKEALQKNAGPVGSSSRIYNDRN
jgi:uncharacterized LabA/DUF88 family protein